MFNSKAINAGKIFDLFSVVGIAKTMSCHTLGQVVQTSDPDAGDSVPSPLAGEGVQNMHQCLFRRPCFSTIRELMNPSLPTKRFIGFVELQERKKA